MPATRLTWHDIALSPAWEWTGLLILSPFLLFPSIAPWLTAVLCVAWLLRALASRAAARGAARSAPVGWPLWVFALSTVMGLDITPYPDLALPKAAGILLGLFVYRATRLAIVTEASAWTASAAYVAVGCLLLLPGAFATAWSAKLPGLGSIATRIPLFVRGLPGSAPEGINPNALAGGLLFLLPLLTVVAFQSPRRRVPASASRDNSPGSRPAVTTWTQCLLGAMAVLLALSQSRMGIASFALTLMLLAALRWRTIRIPVLVLSAAAATTAWLASDRFWTLLNRAFYDAGTGSTSISLTGRVALWGRAVEAIRDFPWTGIGLGAFRRVVFDFYRIPGMTPDIDIAHCHNTFMQTALDLGLPGLFAYLVLLVLAGIAIVQIARHGSVDARNLAIGLGASLLAVHVFGLADAIAPGAKIGVLLWMNFGIVFGLRRVVGVASRSGA